MAERGGYRAPSNPAPVSGPGALSQRTDTQIPMSLPDPAYGEGQEFMDLQKAAPMPQETPMVAPPRALTDPTDFPDEPVTAGAPFGPGPSGLKTTTRPKGQLAEKLYSSATRDSSGYTRFMADLAEQLGL
jgi:hypothetical protein